MPLKPPKCCANPGCRELAYTTGLCQKHEAEREVRRIESRAKRQAISDEHRGSAASRGYDRRWRAYRESFLAKHPLCVQCERRGLVVAAKVVDHVIPHKGDSKTFWDKSNHQALCVACHTAKTMTELTPVRMSR